jgi:hypothetical protein
MARHAILKRNRYTKERMSFGVVTIGCSLYLTETGSVIIYNYLTGEKIDFGI